jgi:NAD(P)-dependent dehydrogenase (short-subunit alcohol dehydrogenase family)
VRVNCVCPGLIDSRMLSAIIQGRNPGNTPTPNEKIVERIPARRSDRRRRSPPSWRSLHLTRPVMSRAPPTPSTVDGPRVNGRHSGARAKASEPGIQKL